MIRKFIAGLCLSVGFLPLAHASLTIDNQTDFSSTAILNNATCSTILGSEGVTKPHDVNTVSDAKVALGCILNRSNCTAKLYMTDNCKGDVVAVVTFDTGKGIKSIENKNVNGFVVSGSGFSAKIEQKK